MLAILRFDVLLSFLIVSVRIEISAAADLKPLKHFISEDGTKRGTIYSAVFLV